MPRKYISPACSRDYMNYSEDIVKRAVDDVLQNRLSQRKAAEKYSIPLSTLKNRVKNRHTKKPGGQKIFSDNEEQSFVDHLTKLSEFGFPVDEADFKMTVKYYLQHKGLTVTKFKENVPGTDWVKRFLRDHPNLSVILSKNVKKPRAAISTERVASYIENLRRELTGIPPQNIWNYDETNVSDNLENKHAVCKRGVKYLDHICNDGEASISLMFCGNAEGKLLPPYVVFKADHVHSSWVVDGPQGARYNCTKSGWFDATVFEDWFRNMFLPAVHHLEGKIALIGDNLSSHISMETLQICKEKNMKFVCLPPNAIHLLQPLDVAFFRLLEQAWQSLLSTWQNFEGSKYQTIPKEKLPGLLKSLINTVELNKKQNLITSFKECGIVPVSKDITLAQISTNEVNVVTLVPDSSKCKPNIKQKTITSHGETFLFSYYKHFSNKPHKFVPPACSRDYMNYSEDTVKRAVDDVLQNQLSQRKAATKYSIPLSTLKNRLKNRHTKKPGGQKIFSDSVEQLFVDHLIKLSEFGFPVDEADFKMSVKYYLQHKGLTVTKFKDNIPGTDWVKRFLRDHPKLSEILLQNVKKSRATISAERVISYIENLRRELTGIPPQNIWNYDETNVSDNLENKHAVCKRGMKYLDHICSYSETLTSLMLCGNAEGKLLPPYVVFKADHMCCSWVVDGPPGARYSCTKSGWFDATVFEDWFRNMFLPAVHHLEGEIALIGDDLSSHISMEILQTCKEKKIKFICLPPNAIHLLQPLDVAFFGPLEQAWQSLLSTWKNSEGSKYPTILREKLPGLLKNLMNAIEPNKKQNLIASFKRCGIVLVNKDVTLAQIPTNEVDIASLVLDSSKYKPNVKRKAITSHEESSSNDEIKDNKIKKDKTQYK